MTAPSGDEPIAGEQLLWESARDNDTVLYTNHPLERCQEARLMVTHFRLIFVTKVGILSVGWEAATEYSGPRIIRNRCRWAW